MTIEEIECAQDASQPLDFSRHPLEGPGLSLAETLYPMGFPAHVRTNSAEILTQVRALWPSFASRFQAEPIHIDVHVKEDTPEQGDIVCPPAPETRILLPLVISVADANHFSVADLDNLHTRISISHASLRFANYLGYHFLGSAPLCHIATRHATPVHAACIALEGRGILLCGDSGAGKSSLAYASARAGWTYITDDASYLVQDDGWPGENRRVIGNCHQVRFRPSASELFPEVAGLPITPRAAGKPSIELPTAHRDGMACAETAQVDFLVFLNRRLPGAPELRPWRKDVARSFLRQVLYGTADLLASRYADVERLLTAEIFELRYTSLDWAVARLETLVRKGC